LQNATNEHKQVIAVFEKCFQQQPVTASLGLQTLFTNNYNYFWESCRVLERLLFALSNHQIYSASYLIFNFGAAIFKFSI
jgi:hypothetical protein